MTPPRTYPFAVYYSDGSYLVWDLTKQDYEKLKTLLQQDPCPLYVELSIGIIGIKEIRAIIEQRESEEQEELPSADPGLSLSELHYLTTLRGSEV